MSLIVRLAEPSDLDALVAIAAASPEAPHWKPFHYAPFLATDPAGPLLRAAFVACMANELLGFGAASLLLDRQDNRAELDSMAVHPDARRRGAGSALLQAVVAWAARHGARTLALEVRVGNTPAIRLYEKFGFRRMGLRPRYYADPEEDALLMGRPVTPVSNLSQFSTGNSVEGGPTRC
jgi:ribosomal-protein-alanine N-acetyltransferase